MFWNNRKIVHRKEQVSLFRGQENLSILHLSDIHLWFSTRILKFLADQIEIHKPEILFLTGDYYDTPTGAHHFRKFLEQVSKKQPVIFIRGNHDMLYGSKVADVLSGIPNCICVDDKVDRYVSRSGIHYNITSWRNKHKLPRRNNEKNIILIHNPEKININELDHIDLILAGHLHGGQFIFFKANDNSYFPGNLLYKYCTDRIKIKNTELIVSKGLGDTFPFRFNCPKEIVHITIR